MRLIDADELVAELIYLYEDRGWHEREIHFSLADMRCNVDIIPTVEPKETILLVPKEEWAIIKEKIISGEVSKIMVGDVEFRKIEVTE